MKSRFAPVKRPLLALTAIAAMVAMIGALPANAVNHNNLSFPGTTGLIRVRPIVANNSHQAQLNQGDPNIRDGNPNRTVGDVPSVNSSLFSTNCAGASSDCLRTLANNDPAVNASATGGITRYNPGDTAIIVNDVTGFQKGDTLLIGSPYCNFPTLGASCKRFIPGFGSVDQQPGGEVVHVIGGDVSADSQGVGVLQLQEKLALTHLEGSTVVKLPTLYQGQNFRVDVDYTALLNCDLARVTCNPHNVNVHADFIPPEGSHDPSFPSRPLGLSIPSNGPFVASVPAACGPSPAPASCGAGFASFYIPSNIVTEATVGRTFSTDSSDTWYSVVVTATDATTGAIVADGIARFKLNPVAITNLRAEHPTAPAPTGSNATFFPGEAVQINGNLRDATALDRPVEDVITQVTVTDPNNGTNSFLVTSCANRAGTAGAKDTCGGDIFNATTDGHGAFYVQYGGPQGVFVSLGFNPSGLPTPIGTGTGAINNSTCNPQSNLFGIIPCVGGVTHVLDTANPGTYNVTASLYGFRPPVTASRQFDVKIA